MDQIGTSSARFYIVFKPNSGIIEISKTLML